jgi:dipeptidyl aminopeptidase/acylaminoacyl peptidase
MSKSLLGAVATALLCATVTATAAAPQPIENFARRPQMYGITISSDGQYIAFLSGQDDDTVLMTFDRNATGSTFKRVAASEPGKTDLSWCRWVNRKRLLCGLFGNIRGKKYAEPPFTRMFGVDADGAQVKQLEEAKAANPFVTRTSMRNLNMNYGAPVEKGNQSAYNIGGRSDSIGGAVATRFVARVNPESQEGLLDITPEDDDTVLIQADDDRDSYPTIFTMNVYTGQRGVRLAEVPPIQEFVTDGLGNPRLGWGSADGLNTKYFVRAAGAANWNNIGDSGAFDAEKRLRPVSIGTSDNIAYAMGTNEGREALWAIDLDNKKAPRLLFHHPLVDVGEPILQTDRRLLGVRYDVERPYVWYADSKLRELIDRLEQQFPGRVHEVVDSSEDRKTILIRSSSDVDAGTYFIYDMNKDKLQRLGTSYPELDQKTLGTMTYITYKSSDGVDIPGYLTIPTGAEKKKLPLVVMPHDGPIERDSWQFDYLRAFLANRGYAVLQMNFRGSAGFGQKWQLDAHQDWGGRSYSDILEATKWAVSEGIADPQRICIVGRGFGGYAALLGAARNSDTFRCAVSINGIADLEMQVDHGDFFSDKDYRRAMIGSDKEKLKRNSPLQLVKQIDVPVLLVHGGKDWQVQIDQSKAMEEALAYNNKVHKAVYIKGAGHDLSAKSERMVLLKEVEAFIEKNMGKGRVVIDDPT